MSIYQWPLAAAVQQQGLNLSQLLHREEILAGTAQSRS